MTPGKSREIGILVGVGGASILLYLILWRFSANIVAYSSRGGWYFLIPLAIAFLFSFVHGSFTGRFWDAMGIKAKSTGGSK